MPIGVEGPRAVPWLGPVIGRPSAAHPPRSAAGVLVRRLDCADPEDEEEDLGDEEDLSVAQPLSDEESDFDDFDDEFDDDFEEEENDPDWDHPDEADSDKPPPGAPPGRRK